MLRLKYFMFLFNVHLTGTTHTTFPQWENVMRIRRLASANLQSVDDICGLCWGEMFICGYLFLFYCHHS